MRTQTHTPQKTPKHTERRNAMQHTPRTPKIHNTTPHIHTIGHTSYPPPHSHAHTNTHPTKDPKTHREEKRNATHTTHSQDTQHNPAHPHHRTHLLPTPTLS